MSLPDDYEERVYAGVLGKIIGVYLGRPFEGWTNARIEERLGDINYYVHDALDVPLVVTDDDISGTLTFIRALADNGHDPDISPAQIGNTWLNYLIEGRTVLWWGGLGNSTEHTAYLRLKQGIEAPRSGSRELNGKVVSEQIGAQIFIDGWAMVSPGDPERAAELARRAASVSHDGEAIYGAQVLAAMEALAFDESDIDKLIDVGTSMIPGNSVIYGMIQDLRAWHAEHPADWRKTFARIQAQYGYDQYGGNCHMVPNHALIVLSLLHGDGDFQKSLMIVNTAGWDTDCNSGNVGCLMGIRGGLDAIDSGPDWRTPVADRIYLPTADAGGAITDVASEAMQLAGMGRRLRGESPVSFKSGARFHFELPGSVQGFRCEATREVDGTCRIENLLGHSRSGKRSLALHYRGLATGRAARAATGTFVESKDTARYFEQRGYALMASPTLYPGQIAEARVSADAGDAAGVDVNLYIQVYDENDALTIVRGPVQSLAPGADTDLEWRIPDTQGYPIAEIGIEARSERATRGTVYLDYLTWRGTPEVRFTRTASGTMWSRAWINAVDQFHPRYPEPFRLMQNAGTGLLIGGSREWRDYRVSADVTIHMAAASGIAARVQGMRRYYALLLCSDAHARLVKVHDTVVELGCVEFASHGETHDLALAVRGDHIEGFIDGTSRIRFTDGEDPLDCGGIALVIEAGRTATQAIEVTPI